jgi:hypothetical protein
MGAYDDGGMTRSVAATSAKESNPIEVMRSAQNALDKALANPKTSMSRLNKLTDNLLKTMNAAIDYKPSNNNTETETPLGTSTFEDFGQPVSPTPPTPQQPMTLQTPQAPQTPPVKTASIDTVLFDDETMPIDIMSDLIFEDIGGQELINIARNDIVNGQTISYQPIKNLSSLQQQYNPNNILSLQQTSDKYFANFPIKLDERIPTTGSGPNGEYVYLEEATGDLIIELVNMPSSEQVDVEITLDGTIYQAVL